jgi:hypothetical protein
LRLDRQNQGDEVTRPRRMLHPAVGLVAPGSRRFGVFDARSEPGMGSRRIPDEEHRGVTGIRRCRKQNVVDGKASISLESYASLG